MDSIRGGERCARWQRQPFSVLVCWLACFPAWPTASRSLPFVSSGQINAYIPEDLETGTASVAVKKGAISSAAQPPTVRGLAPEIFSMPSGLAAVQRHPDYRLIDLELPAEPGDILVFHATGFDREIEQSGTRTLRKPDIRFRNMQRDGRTPFHHGPRRHLCGS